MRENVSTARRPESVRPAEPDMSIVIVCWNNKKYLEPCLRSLFASKLESHYEVVVVDNGSTDGTQSMLVELFPEVDLIQNTENVGLGRAQNQGIEATHGRYVLLLNDDTLVNGASLDAMVKFMDDNPDAGAVGGRLLNADGSFQAGYAKFSTLREEFLIATRLGELLWPGYPSHEDQKHEGSVGWISSACLLLRRRDLVEVGCLDEEYFIYGDEVDLQYRIQKNGRKVYYLPSVETVHYGGRSLNRWRRRQKVYRGKIRFYHKNYGLMRAALLRLMFGALSATKIVVWAGAFVIPAWRNSALLELRSNIEVIRLCFAPV